MSAKTAVDMRLFEYIASATNGSITATELAKLSGAEELLIGMWRLSLSTSMKNEC